MKPDIVPRMVDSSRIFALVVAAGSGTRAGGALPKQYAPIAGKPMLRHCVEALRNHPRIIAVQVVIDPAHHALYDATLGDLSLPAPVAGGVSRADSVWAGLEALAAHSPDYVLVHDAARPFLSAALIDRLLAALAPDTGVVPALPVADTVRRYAAGAWEEVSRDGLFRIQTPQAFSFPALYHLDARFRHDATDEAAAWLAAGKKLAYVEGDPRLQKITTAAELENAIQPATRIATGMGYDVHTLIPAGQAHTICLGGIDIPHAHKLHGHSDADVVIHAVVDAILGALAEGDIGTFFPPSDAQWKGADSAIFLAKACERLAARSGRLMHLDVTLICEAPKIGPHRDAMRQHLAALLDCPLERVSVKATTTERLGFTGREEGIACHAIATLQLPETV